MAIYGVIRYIYGVIRYYTVFLWRYTVLYGISMVKRDLMQFVSKIFIGCNIGIYKKLKLG